MVAIIGCQDKRCVQCRMKVRLVQEYWCGWIRSRIQIKMIVGSGATNQNVSDLQHTGWKKINPHSSERCVRCGKEIISVRKIGSVKKVGGPVKKVGSVKKVGGPVKKVGPVKKYWAGEKSRASEEV